MAKLVFAMNVSLDGFVDHDKFGPSLELFLHWVEQVQQSKGSIYGRTLYEIMRYWDDDQPGWGSHEHAFAAAWRAEPKWVVSRTLTEVGPNAVLISGDAMEAVAKLKAELEGEISVGGAELAQGLLEAGLLDEYKLYVHPVVLGTGRRFFDGVVPRLKLLATDRITEDVVRLAYGRVGEP